MVKRSLTLAAALTYYCRRRYVMRRVSLVLLMLVLLAGAVVAQLSEKIEQADALNDDDRPREAIEVLEDALSDARGGAERAEVYWRLARSTLNYGDQRKDAGASEAELLPIFEQGEQYGIQAVEADPNNHLCYYWQSANVGKWGQTKGVLNSLFRAGDMRDLLTSAIEIEPEHADSYYVLGQLYAQVPGFVSFGNDDYAVSLARRSIDLFEEQYASGEEEDYEYDFFIQLASHLIERNWNSRKRSGEQSKKERNYGNARTELERGFYYEGMIDIPNQDDREEAESLLRRMIDLLEDLSDRTDGQNRNLEKARELLDSI